MPKSIYAHRDGEYTPILIDDLAGSLVIDLCTYSPTGVRCGEVWHIIPREEAVKMARAILKWAEGQE